MATETAGDDRAWLDEQVRKYAELRPHYKKYAEALDEILRLAASHLAPLTIVQARAKTVASFAEKSLRKRGTRPDPVAMFTDLCGARLVARTRSEVDRLCAFIETHFEIDRENSIDASARLNPTEFGYRSVHYIVKLRDDIDYGVEIPDEIRGLKAEIQVRTVAEHAYSDFAHDLTYKGAFPLPQAWQRELAGAAAILEEVDGVFSRVEEGLSEYATSYGKYMKEDEARAEVERLEIVLERVPKNVELADRLARLALALCDWERVIDVLSPFVASEPAATPTPVLRDLGIALCELHRADRGSAPLGQGRSYLELAGATGDVEAICALAATWRDADNGRARDEYRRAFELDPANADALGNYIELELAGNPNLLLSLRPLLRRAMDRCRRHIDAGINLPWALYDLGRFQLLSDEPYEALASYCHALAKTGTESAIETPLASLERLMAALGDRPGFEWARRLLLLGLAFKFSSPSALAEIERLASPGTAPLRAPVAIVAGGTDPRLQDRYGAYLDLVACAFADFEGTILSGGTVQGISGVVGLVGRSSGGRIRSVGYLPETLPDDATPDPNYDELRTTSGQGFSLIEPLQNWIDLAASGIPATSVHLLGIGGGRIAASEYRIALALGAPIGLVADSGREAGRLLGDEQWAAARLLRLPPDRETLRAFISPQTEPLIEPVRSLIGRGIHDGYRQQQRNRPDLDPALQSWASLRADFRQSNLDQADHLAAKLRRIGCGVVVEGDKGEPVESFTVAEIEVMAEMEHGRWTAERLLAGWTWGEVRDPATRRSPYLVGWTELSEEIREIDRQAVRRIPELLAGVGLSIRREPAS